MSAPLPVVSRAVILRAVVISTCIAGVLGFVTGRATRRGGDEDRQGPVPAHARDSKKAPAKPDAGAAAAAAAAGGRAHAAAAAAARSPGKFLQSLSDGGLSKLEARGRILAAVSAMSLDEVKAATARAGETKARPEEESDMFVHSLMERWAELDAKSLFQAAKDKRLGQRENYAGLIASMHELARRSTSAEEIVALAESTGDSWETAWRAMLETVGEDDPQKALAMLNAHPERLEKCWWIPATFFKNWAGQDPAAAFAALEASVPGGPRNALAREMMQSFAAQDPEAALAWCRQAKPSSWQRSALESAFEQIALRDPQRALQLADEPGFAAHRDKLLGGAAGQLAGTDMPAAIALTAQCKSPAERAVMLAAVAMHATPESAPALMDLAAALPAGLSPEICEVIFLRGDLTDPAARTALLERIPSEEIRGRILSGALDSHKLEGRAAADAFATLPPHFQVERRAQYVALELAREDPEAALRWAASLDIADLKDSALGGIVYARAASDPAAAARNAMLIGDESSRNTALRNLVQVWMEKGFTDDPVWAAGLQGSVRTEVFRTLTSEAPVDGSGKMTQWYGEFAAGLSGEEARQPRNLALSRSVGEVLGKKNPAEAVAWAGQLAGPAQHQAWDGIAGAWISTDPAAAARWVDTLPPGEGRDLAALRVSAGIADSDPEAAWQWGLTISDPEKRYAAACRTIDSMLSRGAAETVRNTLASGLFSENETAQLLEKLNASNATEQ